MSTLYDDLGVAPDATDADIRKAFRGLARQHHPDRAGGDHARMSAVNRAYETLSDPERRARYDATGETRGPPSLDDRARSILFQVMTQEFDRQPEGADLVRAVREHLQRGLRQNRSVIAQAREVIEKVGRQRKKLKDAGLFAGLFDQRVAELGGKVTAIEHDNEAIERAIALLADVEWDNPTPQAGFMFVGTATAV